jgi:hypothetical protein
MTPEELRDTARRQPFLAFRVVMTDGAVFDIRHPDLIWVGRRSAMIGLTGQPGQEFYERSVQVALLHVIRLEPIALESQPPPNGPA